LLDKDGLEVTGTVLQYSLMSDCEIIPIARVIDIYIDLNNENGRTYLFDYEKWGVGSRQDQEPLTFYTVPGRRVPLPETTTVSDYFNIFIKDANSSSFSLSLSANIS
jgi:hypothetical protein